LTTERASPSAWTRLRAFLGSDAAPSPAAVLAGLVAVCALSAAWRATIERPGTDYYQWWAAAQAVRRGITGDVYSPRARALILESYYGKAAATAEPGSRYRAGAGGREDLLLPRVSPFTIAAVGLTSFGAYDGDLLRFQILSFAAYVLAILALAQRLRYTAAPALMLVAALTATFDPFMSDARVANISRLQAGLLALYVALVPDAFRRGRHLAAGAALGVAVFLKPNVLFVVLAVMLARAVQRRWSELLAEAAGVAAAGAASAIFTSAWFGTPGCWTSWVRHFPGYTFDLVEFGNFSLAAIAEQKLGWSVGLPMIVLGFAASGAVFWRERAAGDRDAAGRATLAVGLGTAVLLLAAPVAWLHYFVFTVPLVVAAMRPRPGTTAGRALAAQALGLAAIVLVGRIPLLGLFQIDALPAAALAAIGVSCAAGGAVLEAIVPARPPAPP